MLCYNDVLACVRKILFAIFFLDETNDWDHGGGDLDGWWLWFKMRSGSSRWLLSQNVNDASQMLSNELNLGFPPCKGHSSLGRSSTSPRFLMVHLPLKTSLKVPYPIVYRSRDLILSVMLRYCSRLATSGLSSKRLRSLEIV